MKQALSFPVILLAILSIPQSVKAYNFSAVTPSGQTLYYSYSSDSSGVSVYVTYPGNNATGGWDGYTRPTGTLVIPESVVYNGHTYLVTSIGTSAFSTCVDITSISFPNTINSIDIYAFSNCTGLTSLTIPNSVTFIGAGAFNGCSGLTSVVIGDYVTNINMQTFYYCSELRTIIIGKSVSQISVYAFADCSNIRNIICRGLVPPTLMTNAFRNVRTTIPVNIPCGTTSAYSSVWNYFSNFVELTIHSLTVTAADSTMGSAMVTIQHSCQDSTAVIEAMPNCGYEFYGWNDGNISNPRTVVVTQDTSFTAYFGFIPLDTIFISDTVLVHDTVFVDNYISDTIYIHDTIFTEPGGIGDMKLIDAMIYARDGQIVVEGSDDEPVSLYDLAGRLLATRRGEDLHRGTPLQFDAPASGAYLVRIGNRITRKVVVVK